MILALPFCISECNFSAKNKSLGSDKLGIYHPNDCLVPQKASLASLFNDKEKISLNPKDRGGFTHFGLINNHTTDKSEKIVEKIIEFLK